MIFSFVQSLEEQLNRLLCQRGNLSLRNEHAQQRLLFHGCVMN
jgi:hypothetical protein